LFESVHNWPLSVQGRVSAFLGQQSDRPRLIATARRPRSELPIAADLLDRLSTIEIMQPPLRDRVGVRLARQ
jgi:hypothetical protein